MPRVSAETRKLLISLVLVTAAVTTLYAPAPALAGLPRARRVPKATLHQLQRQHVRIVGEKTLTTGKKSWKVAVVDPASLTDLRGRYYETIGLDPAEVDRHIRSTVDRIQIGAAAQKAGIGRTGLSRLILGSGVEPALDALASELRAELGDTRGLRAADGGIRLRVAGRLGNRLTESQIENILGNLGHGFHNGDVAVFTAGQYLASDTGGLLDSGFLGKDHDQVALRYTRGRPEDALGGKPTHQMAPDVRGLTVHYGDQPDTATNQPKQITPRGLEFAAWASLITGGRSMFGKLGGSLAFLYHFSREQGIRAALSIPHNFFKNALPTPDVELQHYWGYPLVVAETVADNGERGVLVARRHYAAKSAPENASNTLPRRIINALKALRASRFLTNRTHQTARFDQSVATGANKIAVLVQFLTSDPAATPLIADGNQAWDLAASPELLAGHLFRPIQHKRDTAAEGQVRTRVAGPQKGAQPAGTFQEDRASSAYPQSAANRGAP